MNKTFSLAIAASVASLALLPADIAVADAEINAGIEADPALHALLPERIRSAGKINVATYAGSAPCDFMEDDGVTFTGWEEDYRQALGKKLGIAMEPVSIAFAGLIPGVESGRYDFAMQCISETPARVEQVNFVNTSISANGIFRLSANEELSEDPLTLCGKTSGALTGTTYGDTVHKVLTPHCTENGKEPIAVQEYASQDAVLLALLSKRIDFIVNDSKAKKYIEENAGVALDVDIPDFMPRFYNGIVVRKDDTELAGALLAGMQAMLNEGITEKVMAKWDLTHIILHEPGINVATRLAAEAAATSE